MVVEVVFVDCVGVPVEMEPVSVVPVFEVVQESVRDPVCVEPV